MTHRIVRFPSRRRSRVRCILTAAGEGERGGQDAVLPRGDDYERQRCHNLPRGVMAKRLPCQTLPPEALAAGP